MSELKLSYAGVSQLHPGWAEKTADQILADMAKAVRELGPPRVRITGIHVHERSDLEYLAGELGELLRDVRLDVFALIPPNHGLLMFSDGSCRLFRVRPDAVLETHGAVSDG